MAARVALQLGQQSAGFDHEFQAHAQRVLANAPRWSSWMLESRGSRRLYGSCIEDDAREDLENKLPRFGRQRTAYQRLSQLQELSRNPKVTARPTGRGPRRWSQSSIFFTKHWMQSKCLS